jgi:hypothetical protein
MFVRRICAVCALRLELSENRAARDKKILVFLLLRLRFEMAQPV